MRLNNKVAIVTGGAQGFGKGIAEAMAAEGAYIVIADMNLDGAKATAAGGAVGFLIVMEFGSGLLQGWFPPLLAQIGTEFSVDDAALNWVSVVYLLMTVAFVPVIGKLGDLYGHKRLLLVTVTLVAAGSIIVAFAPSFSVLLLGRALQAPLGAFLPLEFAIVRSRSGETAGRSIAKLVGALTVGGAIGAMVSGILLAMIDNLTVVLLVPAVFILGSWAAFKFVWNITPEVRAEIAAKKLAAKIASNSPNAVMLAK